MLELAKIAYRDNKIKRQYILPNGEIEILELDGEVFCEADYDVVAVNGSEMKALNDKLENLATAFVQNEKAGLSLIMDIFTATTIQEKRRAIDASEAEQEEKYQQEQKMTQQQFEAKIAADAKEKEEERKLKRENNIRDNETRKSIADGGVAQRDRATDKDVSMQFTDLMQQNEELEAELQKLKIQLASKSASSK